MAVAIHVAVLGGAALYGPSVQLLESSSTSSQHQWLDLELASPPEAPPAVEVPPRERVEEPTADTRVAMGTPHPRPVSPNPPVSGPEGPGPGAVLDPGGSDPNGIPGGRGGDASSRGAGSGTGTGTGSGPRRPINTGIDGSMAWMWTRPNVSTPKPRPASTTGGLQEALDAHDRKVGLGYGGPVVSAFHSAAASPSAPQGGRARFEAIIDSSGRVSSVHVLSANGDMAAWQAVASQVLRILRSRILRVPEGQAIAIVVDVRSRYQMPSGAKPGESVKMEGAGARFDVSDIGAGPAHNVAVHVVTERRL